MEEQMKAEPAEDRKVTLQEGERLDDTGFGGYRLIQKRAEFCYGVDAVLLASFAASGVRPGDRVCDLGTGTGIIPLILAHKTEASRITGVEIQRDSWERACRMAALNGLEGRLHFLNEDVGQLASMVGASKATESRAAEPKTAESKLNGALAAGSFQTVTCNPPYMAGEAGLKSKNEAKRIARHETTAGLADFIAVAAALLEERGEFCLVHRPSRLVDILALCRQHRLEPKELQLVSPRSGQAANIVLVRCFKGGGPELAVLPTLPVYGPDGAYSKEIMEIYERDQK